MPGADATIKFNTLVDPKGFEKGVGDIDNKANGLKKTIQKVGLTISDAFNSKKVNETTAAMMKQKDAIESIENKLRDIATIEASSSLVDKLTIDLNTVQDEAKQITEETKHLEVELEKAINKLEELKNMGFKDADLQSYTSNVNNLTDALMPSWERMSELENEAKGLNTQLSQLNMPNQPKESADELQKKLAVAKQRLIEMGTASKKSTKSATSGLNAAQKSATRFLNRIKMLVVGAFIFRGLGKAIRGFRDYLGKALKDNEAFADSFGKFKANMSAAIQPLVQWITTVLTKGMQMLQVFSQYLLQFSALLSGKSVKAMQASAKAMEKLGAKTKKTNKELSKTTSSFDDLITLQSDSSKNEEDTDGIPGIYSDIAEPSELTKHLKDMIGLIMFIIGGALLVIGAILTFTGANIPLGLGLMAAGAVILAATLIPMWDALSPGMQKTIQSIMLILGTALLVVGAILAFTGAALPLGIALMVLGAAAIAGAIALNPKQLVEAIRGPLGIIMAILGGALLVLGIILVVTGAMLPLGIALIVIGAAALASVVALNFNAIVETVTNVLKNIGWIIGLSLLAIGIILVIVGVTLPLGIALIVAGAAALVSWVALNFNAIVDTITKVLKDVGWIIGLSMLAIGVILLLTGVGIPLGIALIILGVGSLVAAVVLNKDAILNTIKDVLAKIGKFFSNCWEGIKFGAAMAWWGIQVGVISMVNFVIGVINRMVEGILAPFNLIIDGLNNLPGVKINNISFKIKKIDLPPKPQMPALAKGAVLPGGSPFAAIVNDQPAGQTNIEAPLATIEEGLDNVFQKYLPEISQENNAYVAKIEGNMAGFFRYLNIELQREQSRSSAFAFASQGGNI